MRVESEPAHSGSDCSYVVNSRFRSDWAKQIGPECSWDVKVLSCVKKARRLRGEHAKSSATSQAPQAP